MQTTMTINCIEPENCDIVFSPHRKSHLLSHDKCKQRHDTRITRNPLRRIASSHSLASTYWTACYFIEFPLTAIDDDGDK